MNEVKNFNQELAALYECKPPISKAKMNAITKGAIKGIKCYKHIVQSVEKFIQKCKTEYKIPGLYVIDSIVRQSRHQFGVDKDVFAPRFAKNILITFYYLFKCPPEDKSKVIRVLNLWQKNSVFIEEVIQPIFDLVDPNHPRHKEIAAQINQKASKAKQPSQPVAPHTPQQSQTPQKPNTPQHNQAGLSMPTASASLPNSSVPLTTLVGSQVSNAASVVPSLDPNLIQQIQQILMKTDDGPVASAVAALSGIHSQAPGLMQHQTALSMSTQAALMQSQPPPTFTQASIHQLAQSAAMQDQNGLPACDFDGRPISYMPVDMSQPPPGYMQNFGVMTSAAPPPMMNAGIIPSGVVHVAEYTQSIPIPSENKLSPREEGEHSGDSDDNKQNHSDDQVIEIKDKSRSPSYSRSSRRSRRRSRSRSRSKSRHRRSRSRTRRSRSRDRRDRGDRDRRGGRDKDRERTDPDKEAEREKEKERKKRGLPPMKHEHLSVCSTTLWVGHLSKLVHQEELSDTFGEYGDIVSINLIPPRGCAFICMNRRQDASRALTKLRNYKMLNKTITLAWAPGKGVKGKDFKDSWEVEAGCSYVPFSKLTTMNSTDLDSLEEGGVIDEDTVPGWLKSKLTTRHGEEVIELPNPTHIPPPNMLPMNLPPPSDQGLEKVPMMPAFSIANIPPPGMGGLPMMPPMGIRPPMGMPPMNVAPVTSMMGHSLIGAVPPHVSIAPNGIAFSLAGNANPIVSVPPMQMNNPSQDMDIEMEDVEKNDFASTSMNQKAGMLDVLQEAEAHSPMDPNAEAFENFQARQGLPMQVSPFGSAVGTPPIGIRFGIMPRSAPGFAPRSMAALAGFPPRNFLAAPPPVLGGRPGLVPEMGGLLPPGIGFRPMGAPPGMAPPSLAGHFVPPSFNRPPPVRPAALPSMTEILQSETAKDEWNGNAAAKDRNGVNGFFGNDRKASSEMPMDISDGNEDRNVAMNGRGPPEFGDGQREDRFRGRDRGRDMDRFDRRRPMDRGGYAGHDRDGPRGRPMDHRRDRQEADRPRDRDRDRSRDFDRDHTRGGGDRREPDSRPRYREDRKDGSWGRNRWSEGRSRWEGDKPRRRNDPSDNESRPETPKEPAKPSEEKKMDESSSLDISANISTAADSDQSQPPQLPAQPDQSLDTIPTPAPPPSHVPQQQDVDPTTQEINNKECSDEKIPPPFENGDETGPELAAVETTVFSNDQSEPGENNLDSQIVVAEDSYDPYSVMTQSPPVVEQTHHDQPTGLVENVEEPPLAVEPTCVKQNVALLYEEPQQSPPEALSNESPEEPSVPLDTPFEFVSVASPKHADT